MRDAHKRRNISKIPSNVESASFYGCSFLTSLLYNRWVLFLDVDEFLVLKKTKNVVDLAQEYAKDGAVAISSQVFGTNGLETYDTRPVVFRFQCIVANHERNGLVKSLVKLDDVSSFDAFDNPYVFPTKKGKFTLDTKGIAVKDPKHFGPMDVAVVNKYYYQSKEEFVEKVAKTDLLTGEEPDDATVETAQDGKDPETGKPIPEGSIHDDTAWKVLKEGDPFYIKYASKSADVSTCKG